MHRRRRPKRSGAKWKAGVTREDCGSGSGSVARKQPLEREGRSGVSGQYHQSVSAKAQTRSPKSEGRKKAETRNPKCPSVASAFGIRPSFGFRPSEFGFGRLATGGTVQIRPGRSCWHCSVLVECMAPSEVQSLVIYRGVRGMDYKLEPLTPALSPSEGEREKPRQIGV